MANGIIETITNNWILSIGIAALIIYAVWDFMKRRRMKKKEREVIKRKVEEAQRSQEEEQKISAARQRAMEEKLNEEPQYNEIINVETKNPEQENKSLSAYFTDKKDEPSKKDMGLNDYSQKIASSKKEIEQKIREEQEQLKKELQETTKKKEELRKHGLALAELFDKYAEREEQLKEILNKK